MLYNIMLYMALSVFVIGLIYKVSNWFYFSIGINTGNMTALPRIMAALKGLFAVFFSQKLLILCKVFILDVILQIHILKQDTLRWVMHMLIFAGFMFLLITHAFDRIITTSLFDKYYLALNPLLIISGLLVISGITIAIVRRYILKVSRLKTNAMDLYAIIMIAVIILSGMAMEITKLTSYDHYQKIWYLHIVTCLLGLGYLPFSKMFHMFTTPLSLLTNAVMDENSDPANIMTRRAIELDACTRCNTCSKLCSVAVASDSIGNENILPSERMAFLKDYIANKDINAKKLRAIQDGIYLCTNCDRCTVACPAGINLRDLWFSAREELIQRKNPVALMLTPFSYFRGLNHQKIDPEQYGVPLNKAKMALTEDSYSLSKKINDTIVLTSENKQFKNTMGQFDRIETFAHCFACENCSTVCPVAGNYENSQKSLDLLPHQIMRSMALGLKEMAMGSRMLWSCLTCYQCQEHCPQGVKVTDILFKLKNISVKDQECQ